MEAKKTLPPLVKEAVGASVAEDEFVPVVLEIGELVPRGSRVEDVEVNSTANPPSEVVDATIMDNSVDKDGEPVIIAEEIAVLEGEDAAAFVEVASAMKLGEYIPVPSYEGHPATVVFGGALPPPQSRASQISPVPGTYQRIEAPPYRTVSDETQPAISVLARAREAKTMARRDDEYILLLFVTRLDDRSVKFVFFE